jgi:hypothetical protein
MKIRNSQVDTLSQVLGSLGAHVGAKLVYFVAMNLRSLQPIVESLRAARKASPGYLEYERRRNLLCIEYANRDEQLQPISNIVSLPGGGGTATVYVIKERKAEFDTACAELDKEFQDVCQQKMAQEVEVHALMQQEVAIDLVRIRMSECPEDVITGDIAAVLMAADLLEWDVEKPGDQTEI